MADYLAAKIFTFEPGQPSFRQSYTVFEMGTDCAESDAVCHAARLQKKPKQQGRGQGQGQFVDSPADHTALTTSRPSSSQQPPTTRSLLQSVGNLQEATLELCVHEEHATPGGRRTRARSRPSCTPSTQKSVHDSVRLAGMVAMCFFKQQ